MVMGFKFHMGMGIKSLKWEGIGTKNLFPHTSITQLTAAVYVISYVSRPIQLPLRNTKHNPITLKPIGYLNEIKTLQNNIFCLFAI